MLPEIARAEMADPEKEKTTPVSKIHFLMHPGYITDANHDPLDPHPIGPEELGDYAVISKRYQAKAEEVKNRAGEIMVAFLHKPGKQFRQEYKSPSDYRQAQLYTQIIEDLKKILGNRLIVLSQDFNIVKDPQKDLNALAEAREAWQAIIRIAQAKGYTISKAVEKEAYGEWLAECVLYGAGNLDLANELTGKTVVRPKLTERATGPAYPDMPQTKKQVTKLREYKKHKDPPFRNIDFKF